MEVESEDTLSHTTQWERRVESKTTYLDLWAGQETETIVPFPTMPEHTKQITHGLEIYEPEMRSNG